MVEPVALNDLIDRPDRLDTFDFDKFTLKIITSARKHQAFQFFQINRSRNKKMPF
jgi:hypothetical protein